MYPLSGPRTSEAVTQAGAVNRLPLAVNGTVAPVPRWTVTAFFGPLTMRAPYASLQPGPKRPASPATAASEL